MRTWAEQRKAELCDRTELIQTALRRAGGDSTKAARLLDMNRSHLATNYFRLTGQRVSQFAAEIRRDRCDT